MRAVESVARLGSVRQAAIELRISSSAVRHQLRSLETYLGVQLFRRSRNGTELTFQGRAYSKILTRFLDGLEEISNITTKQN